jgi:hypothetical protein
LTDDDFATDGKAQEEPEVDSDYLQNDDSGDDLCIDL